LRASDLNSDSSSEIVEADDLGKSKDSSQDPLRRKSVGKAVSKVSDDDEPELGGSDPVPDKKADCESVDEKMTETCEETATVADSEGENDQVQTPVRKDFDKVTPEKNPLEEMQEDNVFIDNDKERNEDEIDKSGNADTPTTLRRSSRTKVPSSPVPNDRTTRSQINPDIIAKQKSFMHKYQMAVKSPMVAYVRSAAGEPEPVKIEPTLKRKLEDSGVETVQPCNLSAVPEKKIKKSVNNNPIAKVGHFMEMETSPGFKRHDTFCWSCHTDGQVLECHECPRVFHHRCVQHHSTTVTNWLCPECVAVRNAEKHNRLSGDMLRDMLDFAMERIKTVVDSQPFFKPVSTDEFPHYEEYVIYPVDISHLELNIKKKTYSSTRAFLAEFRWILHNCIVFNSTHSKLTNTARTLMKVCKHEMTEIDTCADCYMHAHTKRDTWFLEPCRRPHMIIWAKLKGFPYWPAKAMKASKENNVDVRFFGAHDRAWIPAKDCFLYSQEMPMTIKNKRKATLDASMEEVDRHIKKLVEHFGPFTYPPVKTPYNPHKEEEQLQLLFPGYSPKAESIGKNRPLPITESSANGTKSIHSDNEAESSADNMDPVPTPVSRLPLEDEEEDCAEEEPAKEEPAKEEPAKEEPAKEEPVEDRVVDRNFLAMLQLTPRITTETTTTTTSISMASSSPCPNVVSSSDPEQIVTNLKNSANIFKLQGKTYKVTKVTRLQLNSGETLAEVAKRNTTSSSCGNSETTCDSSSPMKVYLGPSNASDPQTVEDSEVPVKIEPSDDCSTTVNPSKSKSKTATNCSISIAIDNVVGNYREDDDQLLPEPSFKTTSKSKSTSSKSTTKSTSRSTPKGNVKSNAKSLSKTSTPKSSKTTSSSNKQVANDGDELDPAMYLDPTITITLVNSDAEKKRASKVASVEPPSTGSISSSDLQALNALREIVSITVVPKGKSSNSSSMGRFKENELTGDQSMVVEVDPTSLQKARNPVSLHAKARKSFPKSSHSAAAIKKNAFVPMVTIPSRHLGMEIARSSSCTPSTTPKAPSITVRPVSQLAHAQPSIILQSNPSAPSGAAATAAAAATTATAAATAATAADLAGIKSLIPTVPTTTNPPTLTLNAMHALGPDSAFGTGGLLLTFNRSLPAFTTANPTPALVTSTVSGSLLSTSSNKTDIGPVSAQLAAKTNHIADMVQNSLEMLLKEASLGGNLEATIVRLQLDLERAQFSHQKEMAEMKRTLEMRQATAEADKRNILAEAQRHFEIEKHRAVDEAKKKQWCAQCSQEAIFYCCWNTAYCDYPCQQSHWPKHMVTCANANQNVESSQENAASPVPDGTTRAPSPQKPLQPAITVNGTPNVSPIKESSSTTKVAAENASPVPPPSDLGHTVISSSCNISTQSATVSEAATSSPSVDVPLPAAQCLNVVETEAGENSAA